MCLDNREFTVYWSFFSSCLSQLAASQRTIFNYILLRKRLAATNFYLTLCTYDFYDPRLLLRTKPVFFFLFFIIIFTVLRGWHTIALIVCTLSVPLYYFKMKCPACPSLLASLSYIDKTPNCVCHFQWKRSRQDEWKPHTSPIVSQFQRNKESKWIEERNLGNESRGDGGSTNDPALPRDVTGMDHFPHSVVRPTSFAAAEEAPRRRRRSRPRQSGREVGFGKLEEEMCFAETWMCAMRAACRGVVWGWWTPIRLDTLFWSMWVLSSSYNRGNVWRPSDLSQGISKTLVLFIQVGNNCLTTKDIVCLYFGVT